MVEYQSPYSNTLNRPRSRSSYSFKIDKLVIAPTQPYGYVDMVNRPFQARITEHTINHVLDDVIRYGSLQNTSHSTDDIVHIGAAPLSIAGITGGWREKRYTFQLTVRCEPRQDLTQNSNAPVYDLILTGYSDPSSDFAIEQGGGSYVIDTNLRFYINGMRRVTISTSRNIITSTESIGITSPESYTKNNIIDTSMRPVDIVSDINTRNLAEENRGIVRGSSSSPSITALSFSRNHSIGKEYINDIVNAVTGGCNSTFNSHIALTSAFGGQNSSIYSSASYLLEDNTYNTDPFILALMEDNMRFGQYGPEFNIETLCQVDPSFTPDRIDYVKLHQGGRFEGDVAFTAQDTQDLVSADRMHALATEVHQVITTLLYNRFLSHIKISLWNIANFDGLAMRFEPKWEVLKDQLTYAYNPNDNDSGRSIAVFKQAIDAYVKYCLDPLLSANGERKYECLISSDVQRDTTIMISLDGEPPVIYRFPTFADMTFTPMMSNHDVKDGMVANVSALTNRITNELTSASGYY